MASFRASTFAGEFSRTYADADSRFAAISTGESGYLLSELRRAPVWPGHIGYFAVSELVAGSSLGALSLRVICEQMAVGRSADEAFKFAFGVERAAFEASFRLPPDPRGLGQIRGTVVSQSRALLNTFYVFACPLAGGDCPGSPASADGSFAIYAAPGKYVVGVNWFPRAPGTGAVWYTPGGMTSREGAAIIDATGPPVSGLVVLAP
ncbi:MAG: hypothetical protein ABI782_04870 [Anaerolineaceae bacterium]